MKEIILNKAGDIFLKLGFKSVTMDDIAHELGISKKTIYKYFKNKADLVDETTAYMHEKLHKEALKVYDLGYNAIEENFEVNKVFKGFMQNLDNSPIYQLQKYYPETYNKMMSQEFCLFKDCVLSNIQKGIKSLYSLNAHNHVQGLVVRNKTVIIKETSKGTKKMLQSINRIKNNGGILIKLPKKKQDLRTDLPTIGLDTLKDCKKANLKGIVLKSKYNIIMDKKECISFANKNKIFIKVI